MKRTTTLALRLREVFLNGRWVAGTNYQDQIGSIDRERATRKIGNLNTIAALTYHVNYYLQGLLHAFETGKLEIRDQFSFDMQPILSQSDWDNLKTNFLNNAEKFAAHIEQLQDQALDQPFVEAQYGTLLRNIEAVIEHSYYHLGQIALINKML